ncbi:hypothetical protein D3C78_1672250 [compost metagenome]
MANQKGSLPREAREIISKYCNDQGIRFVYFAQGEKKFLYHGINGEHDQEINLPLKP